MNSNMKKCQSGGTRVEKSEASRSRSAELVRSRTLSVVVYILLGLWALMVLFPFLWMILTSIVTQKAYINISQHNPVSWGNAFTFENYTSLFSNENVLIGSYLWNTLLFAVVTTALMLVIIIPAAFAFARLEFRGKNLLFTVFLALMMIPNELVVITNYYTISAWGMKNTLMGLVLPSVTSIFYIYLLKENFAQIPDQLYRAAKVDGTSDFKYMWKVMLPICKPTIITITILKIIECWNSYAWPRLITDEPKRFLVSQGIEQIRNTNLMGNYPGMMAAVVVVSVPLVVLFLIFRNKIMAGVAMGGTKG